MASSAMLNFVLIVMGMAPKSTGSIQLCFFPLGGGRVSLVCGYSAGLHVQQGVVWLWTFCSNDRGWKERGPFIFSPFTYIYSEFVVTCSFNMFGFICQILPFVTEDAHNEFASLVGAERGDEFVPALLAFSVLQVLL